MGFAGADGLAAFAATGDAAVATTGRGAGSGAFVSTGGFAVAVVKTAAGADSLGSEAGFAPFEFLRSLSLDSTTLAPISCVLLTTFDFSPFLISGFASFLLVGSGAGAAAFLAGALAFTRFGRYLAGRFALGADFSRLH